MKFSVPSFIAALGSLLVVAACGSPAPAADARTPPADDTSRVQIALRSEPSPPIVGENTFVAELTPVAGEPVADLTVALDFYMAPMPSMNMPEMRHRFPLTHVSDGTFQGVAHVMMAGRWEVTVDVQQSGERIGQRTFPVTAK